MSGAMSLVKRAATIGSLMNLPFVRADADAEVAAKAAVEAEQVAEAAAAAAEAAAEAEEAAAIAAALDGRHSTAGLTMNVNAHPTGGVLRPPCVPTLPLGSSPTAEVMLPRRGNVKAVAYNSSQQFLQRDSQVPTPVYLRYQETLINREQADATRREKEALRQLREQHAAEWAGRGRELVREGLERQNHTKSLQKQMQRRNKGQVREIRAKEADWELEREHRRQQHVMEARMRVLTGAALQVQMNEMQRAEHSSQRAECTRSRVQLAKDIAIARERNLATRKRMAKRVGTVPSAELTGQLLTAAARRAKEVREDEQNWKAERGRRDEMYLERARANKQRAQQTRGKAKQALADALKSRQQGAAKERANDHLVVVTKTRILEENRKEVSAIYKQRFVTANAATEWEGSSLKRLADAATWLVSHAQTRSSFSSSAQVTL